MNKNSNYFHVQHAQNFFMLDNRTELDYFEILAYPVPVYLCLLFVTNNFLIPIPLTVLIGGLYFLFRYFSWLFFTEFRIDKRNRNVMLVKKKLAKVSTKILIDEKFDFNKLYFEKHEKSGKDQYLMIYKTYKKYPILVLKSENHKNFVEKELKKLF